MPVRLYVLIINLTMARGINIEVAMVPRGEVGLVFAELGKASGIFTQDIYAGLLLVIVLTTLISPFVMKWFYGHYGHRL